MNLDYDYFKDISQPSIRAEFLAYLHILKPYLVFSTGIFLLSIIFGYAAGVLNLNIGDILLNWFEKSYVEEIANAPLSAILLFIFINNTFSSFISILGGIVTRIWPIIFLLINGILIGVVIFNFYSESIVDYGTSYSILLIMGGIIPHGIIELPMILISASIGLRLGTLSLREIFTVRDDSGRTEIYYAVRFFFLVIVPLLLLAAIIETFITSSIIFILMT